MLRLREKSCRRWQGCHHRRSQRLTSLCAQPKRNPPFWLFVFLCLPVESASPLVIVDPGQGPVPLAGGSGGGLSGIAFRSKNQYFTVSDSGSVMFHTTIDVNSESGFITGSPSIGTPVALSQGIDLEGITYDPTDNTVIVSDETGPTLRRHSIAGASRFEIPIPAVYANSRLNFGLESVSMQFGTSALWTANEEALSGDGRLSTTVQGSAIRVTNLSSNEQWVYITDPIRQSFLGNERSGVVDIIALAADRLLVLEREFSFGFRNRIYEVDFSEATNVADLPALDTNANQDLDDETWRPLRKGTPLWEQSFLLTNFEGTTLGPRLRNGDHALLLVSDDEGGLNQSVYMLHLSGTIPEPSTLSLLFLLVVQSARRRRR